MEHFAGIDVSLKDSSICVVDAAGRIEWRPLKSSLDRRLSFSAIALRIMGPPRTGGQSWPPYPTSRQRQKFATGPKFSELIF